LLKSSGDSESGTDSHNIRRNSSNSEREHSSLDLKSESLGS
jgi:hypothetical protein